MEISCPSCDTELTVEDSMVGQTAKCPDCQAVFLVLPPPPPPAVWWVSCPCCSRLIETTDDAVGTQMTCPACRQVSTVTGNPLYSPPPVDEGDLLFEKMEVRQRLGSPTGHTYQVHHTVWQTDLMVRVLGESYVDDEDLQDAFLDCLEPWIALPRHPHVQPCYGSRYAGRQPAWVMEYTIGGNLQRWLYTGKLYDGAPDDVLYHLLHLAVQLAWGLDFLHEYELIHGHLSPTNLLMDGAGRLCISDIGVYQGRLLIEPRDACPGTSRRYRAPEQDGDASSEPTVDIYGWGLNVLTIFLGKTAWSTGAEAIEALRFLHDPGRAANGVPIPAAPEALIDLLHGCLQANPDQRLPHPAALIDSLNEIIADLTGDYPRPKMPDLACRCAMTANNRALSCYDLGLREEGDDLLREALEMAPDQPAALYNHGLNLWRKGNLDDQTLLKEIGQLPVTEDHRALLQAYLQLERGNPAEVVQLLEPHANESLTTRSLRETLQLARQKLAERDKDSKALPAHRQPITALDAGQHGRFLQSAGEDHMMHSWDVGRGVRISSFKGHTEPINSVAFSADGRLALSASGDFDAASVAPDGEGNTPPAEKTLRLWEVDSGECLSTFKDFTEPVAAACFSAAGRFAVALCRGHQVRIIDPQSGRLVQTLPAYAAPGESLLILPDSQLLLAPGLTSEGDCDSPILWDLASGQPIRQLAALDRTDPLFAYEAGGQFAVNGFRTAGEPSPLYVWDLDTGECTYELAGHPTGLTALTVSHGGALVVSIDLDGTACIWETATMRCLFTFQHEDAGPATFLPGSSGQPLIALAQGSTIHLRRLGSTGQAPYIFSHLSYTDSELAERSMLSEYIRDVQQELNLGNLHHAHEMVELALGMDRFADHPELHELEAEAARFGPLAGLEDQALLQTAQLDTAGILAIGFSHQTDGGLIGCSEGIIHAWDLDTGDLYHAWESPVERLHYLTFARAADMALSCHYDRSLVFWDLQTDDVRRLYRPAHPPGTALAISPTGDCCVVASDTTSFELIDTASGQVVRTFNGHNDRITSLDISPDGLLALSGSIDRMVRVWELSTGACLRTTPFFRSPVRIVRFSANGRAALIGSDGQPMTVWDLISNEKLAQVGTPQTRPESSAWTTDRRWLLAGERSREVDGIPKLTLWQVSEEKPADTLVGLEGLPITCAFSPDASLAIAAGSNRGVALWRLTWSHDIPERADWDDEAWPYLRIFLSLRTPRKLTADGAHTLARAGTPRWDDHDFALLMDTLSQAGLGAIPEEAVLQRLQNLAAIWRHPKSALG